MTFAEFQSWYKTLLYQYHLTGTLKARTKDDHIIMMEEIYKASLTDTKVCSLFYNALKNSRNKIDLYKRYKGFVHAFTYTDLISNAAEK